MLPKDLLKKILSDKSEQGEGSVQIDNPAVIEQFITESGNTFLVSFPRTGSHWLRMIMELYFQRPSLVRVFYFPEKKDYICLHTHDVELDVERPDVIYLYRDPVDTIFSQLNYYQESVNSTERIKYWSDLYGRHLDKWLHRENFTIHKTILTYEGLKTDIVSEFTKITNHFNERLDADLLLKAASKITKIEVKRKTVHDNHVVSLGNSYSIQRNEFRQKQGSLVWNTVMRDREYLQSFFKRQKES